MLGNVEEVAFYSFFLLLQLASALADNGKGTVNKFINHQFWPQVSLTS